MSSTILAFKAHNDQTWKIRYANLAHSCLSHHCTSMARNLEDCCFVIHKITLFKRFSEIEFSAYLLLFNWFLFSLCILFVVSHLNELLNWSLEMSYLHVFIDFRSKRVLDCWVATWISNFDCQREFLSVNVLFDIVQKHLELFIVFRFMNFPQRLMKLQLIVSSQKVAFNSVDFCLSIGWNFEIDFFKVNNSVLRFDKLSVQIIFIHDSEENLHSEVRKLPTELHFIVSVSTMLTVERCDDDFSEEGDFGHQKSSLSIFVAIGALTFNDSGWIES